MISYETAQKMIEIMKELNKTLYKTILSTEFMEKLIEKSDELTIISLFLKEFLSNNAVISSYDVSFSYTYGTSSKKYDNQKVIKFFDEKIAKIESDKFLDKIFYTEIFSELCSAKKSNKNENTHIFNRDNLQIIRKKIKIFITNILEPIGDQLKNIELINEVY